MRDFKGYLWESKFNNWIRYNDQSLNDDFKEYKKKEFSKWERRAKDEIGARFPIFDSLESFKDALDSAEIVEIDKLHEEVLNLTENPSINSIKQMVSSYIKPRDVDRIVNGYETNAKMPLPIILKGDKSMWIMAGNTRQSTARVMGIEPKALLVDVSSMNEESIPNQKKNGIAETIKKDCKSFLTRYFKNGNILYRGMKDTQNLFDMKTVRDDRRPTDTKKKVHEVIDDWFNKKFGFRYRSAGVFASNDKNTASIYPMKVSFEKTVYAIFPIGDCHWVFDNEINDLYDDLTNSHLFRTILEEYQDDYSDDDYRRLIVLDRSDLRKYIEDWRKSHISETFYENFMDYHDYVEDKIPTSSDVEIMIQCKSYYMIEADYFDDNKDFFVEKFNENI